MAIVAALILELALILLLLSLGRWSSAPEESPPTIVRFEATSVPERAAPRDEPASDEVQAPKRAEPHEPASEQPRPQPREALPAATPPDVISAAPEEMASFDLSKVKSPQAASAAAATAPVYGPSDSGSGAVADSMRVGTAPNGEPLYAAAWYRKPRDDELRGYLSAASGPGWGLIACRTAPDFRVEDCVPLEESPSGSNINRSILAAAWQFKVRPPRLGGRHQVGAWVRIRIDYDLQRR